MQCREVYKSKIDTNLIALQIENYKRILRANNIWPGLLQVENVGYHFELENNQRTLQNAGPSGCVFLGRIFKNAAQNDIKPRFLKTGLKGARPSRVLYAGPRPKAKWCLDLVGLRPRFYRSYRIWSWAAVQKVQPQTDVGLQSHVLGRVIKCGLRKRGLRPNGPMAAFLCPMAAF